jgi:hypothetical protein
MLRFGHLAPGEAAGCLPPSAKICAPSEYRPELMRLPLSHQSGHKREGGAVRTFAQQQKALSGTLVR